MGRETEGSSNKKHQRFNKGRKQQHHDGDARGELSQNHSNSNDKRPPRTDADRAKRRERRKRLQEVNAICFLCRQKGHLISHCPQNTGGKQGKGGHRKKPAKICYRCGSSEHPVSQCSKKHDPENPYPFAECFVCNSKGHLAGQCPQNEKGLYPHGGCCRFCGSVRHLARDCRPAQKEKGVITLEKMDIRQGGDDDVGVYIDAEDQMSQNGQDEDDLTETIPKPVIKPQVTAPAARKVIKF